MGHLFVKCYNSNNKGGKKSKCESKLFLCKQDPDYPYLGSKINYLSLYELRKNQLAKDLKTVGLYKTKYEKIIK